MSSIVKKNFDSPDEVRAPDKAKVHVCQLGDVAAARLTLEPGWSWSSCVKPMVGGDSCQARHVGTVIQGTMVAKHNDGTTQTFKAGDTYIIEPGHDGWVEGDEAVVAFEFNSTAAQMTPPAFAMKSGTTSTPRWCSRASASGVAGILAPCRISRAWIRSAFPS